MSLQTNIESSIKDAMRAKDKIALESLRAVKSAILLAKTQQGSKEELSEEEEIQILQRLVKQRKESAEIYEQQNRVDLVEDELKQVVIIEKFLPKQLSEEEVKKAVSKVITQLEATSMKDMGKVMGVVSKQLAGQADGRTISTMVKTLLS